jgi:hypothetical protein
MIHERCMQDFNKDLELPRRMLGLTLTRRNYPTTKIKKRGLSRVQLTSLFFSLPPPLSTNELLKGIYSLPKAR